MGRLTRSLLFIIGFSAFYSAAHSQAFQFLSPSPGATLVPTRTSIAIRKGPPFDGPGIVADTSFTITGSSSGAHPGRGVLSDDRRTLLIYPSAPFVSGETVTVELKDGLRTAGGTPVGALRFSFTTRPGEDAVTGKIPGPETLPYPEGIAAQEAPGAPPARAALDSIPASFPKIRVLTPSLAGDMQIFLSNFTFDTSIVSSPYLMILSTSGKPLFYRGMRANCFDFKWQPNGQMTYYDASLHEFLVMDSSFTVVDTVQCGNGYTADLHELHLLPDGHAILMAYDPEPVDMSAIVPNGKPNAIVTGLILQELDRDRNVIFQWRSWDHFAITDAQGIDLTAPAIDYVHGNAVDFDADSNFILSSRHMCEITKIDRKTGQVIWRWGGKNNQFTNSNDPVGFSYQHAIRKLANGHFIMFDNGNLRTPPYSRVVEYQLDEVKKSAALVWEYRHTPDIYGFAMGYAERMDDGTTLIGWGAATPSVTLVGQDKSTLFELTMPTGMYSYRAVAYRMPPTFQFPFSTPGIAGSYALDQNFPNPFNLSTVIQYQISAPQRVRLVVYDVLGRVVETLVDADQDAGSYAIKWNADKAATGVYLYRLEAGGFKRTLKMILMK